MSDSTISSHPSLVKVSSPTKNGTIDNSNSPTIDNTTIDNTTASENKPSSPKTRQPPQPPPQSSKKKQSVTGGVYYNNSKQPESNNNTNSPDQGNKFFKNLWNLVKDSSMFFRLGFQARSAVESLLDRQDCTLEELLDEEDVLQETKAHNAKLIEFLKKTENLTKIIEFLTIEVKIDPEQLNRTIASVNSGKQKQQQDRMDSSDENDQSNHEENAVYIDEEKLAKRSRKYPLLAAEILCCDIEEIYSAIVSDKILMSSLLAFIVPAPHSPHWQQEQAVKPALNAQLAGCWIRVMNCILQRKGAQVQKYIITDGDDKLVQSFVDHLDVVGMDEILLKLMLCDNIFSTADNQTALQQLKMKIWLQSGGGRTANADLSQLIGNQQQGGNSEQATAQEVAEWWLSHGIIDRLLGQYHPRQDPDLLCNVTRLLCEIVKKSAQQQKVETSLSNPLAAALLGRDVAYKLIQTVLKDNILLRETLPFLSILLDTGIEIMEQQHHQQEVHDTQEMEESKTEDQYRNMPLPDAVQVIVSHLPDLVNLLRHPPHMEPMMTTFGVLDPPLGETRLRVIEFMSTLFHLANHNSEIESALISSQVLVAICELFFQYEFNNFLHSLFLKTVSLIICAESPGGRRLCQNLIMDCNLLDRIVEANRANDLAESQPKGMRKGYMGHMTQISNYIVQSASQDVQIRDFIAQHQAWNEYVRGPLQDRNIAEARQIGAPLSQTSSGRSSPLLLGADQQQNKGPLLDQKQQEELDKEFEMFDDDMEFDSSSSDDDEDNQEKTTQQNDVDTQPLQKQVESSTNDRLT